MKVKLLGVRGSIPTTGHDTKFFGGQTSCVLVEERNTILILDAGSGIQNFNKLNIERDRFDLLLSHLHFDHIQGLGFFSPLFKPHQEVHIWGPASYGQSLHSRLSRYLSPPLFPVVLRDLPCKLTLHEIGRSRFTIGHMEVWSDYIIHPGPTLGFRVIGENTTFTYLPDHEPALGKDGIIPDPEWISGYELSAGTDLLYHDGQYSKDEYRQKIGWGHSAITDVLRYAGVTNCKRLLIGHHDPSRTDTQVNELFYAVKNTNDIDVPFEMAVEGMEIHLS